MLVTGIDTEVEVPRVTAVSRYIELLDTTDVARRLFGYQGPTRIWTVKNRTSGLTLGEIRWNKSWGCYCLWPSNCILSPECLNDIAEFCKGVATQNESSGTLKSAA